MHLKNSICKQSLVQENKKNKHIYPQNMNLIAKQTKNARGREQKTPSKGTSFSRKVEQRFSKQTKFLDIYFVENNIIKS